MLCCYSVTQYVDYVMLCYSVTQAVDEDILFDYRLLRAPLFKQLYLDADFKVKLNCERNPDLSSYPRNIILSPGNKIQILFPGKFLY